MPPVLRTASLALALLAGLGAGCARSEEAAGTGRPNVLLILIDTLRADHLGLYGYARDTSPHLDALARESIVYARAISSAPWTTPASIGVLTSMHPSTLGIAGQTVALAPDTPRLSTVLKRAGYRTHGVVSHIYVSRRLGFAHGFDTWNEENARGHTYVSSAAVTDAAIARLEAPAGAAGRPFYMFLHYFDPHFDYVEHPGYAFAAGYAGPLASHDDNIWEIREKARRGLYAEADYQHLRDLYDSEIRFTDQQLGRLFDALRERGLYDDTLIVVTADHGEALAERDSRWIGHSRTLYQEALHVPLLIKLPQSASPRRVEAPVSTVDVMPTILDELGVREPRLPGLAQRSLLRDELDDPVLAETRYDGANLVAVVRGPWKLIVDRNADTRRLFQLERDPGELRDLARDEPGRVRELSRLIATFEADNADVRRLFSVGPAQLDQADRERLRELGYADSW